MVVQQHLEISEKGLRYHTDYIWCVCVCINYRLQGFVGNVLSRKVKPSILKGKFHHKTEDVWGKVKIETWTWVKVLCQLLAVEIWEHYFTLDFSSVKEIIILKK